MLSRRYFLILFILLLCGGIAIVRGQEVLRIEMEASNFSLPFYTIPAGEQGVMILKGNSIKGRRISSWELVHHDVAFDLLFRHVIEPDRSGTFSGWDIDTAALTLLFLQDPPGLTGEVFIYHFRERRTEIRRFRHPGITLRDPYFHQHDKSFYMVGAREIPTNLFNKPRGEPELILLKGSMLMDTTELLAFPLPGLTEVALVKGKAAGNGILLVVRISTGGFSEDIAIITLNTGNAQLKETARFSAAPGKYISDMCFLDPAPGRLALAGTYGTRDKRSWRRGEPVLAEGLFFGFSDSLDNPKAVSYYSFGSFRNLTSSVRQQYYKGSRTTAGRQPPGSTAHRMLLHADPYSYNGNMLMAGEVYYPEYEYENRTQYYAYPYAYYGYYPGFYDSPGRWVFKGFRYQYAMVAAFDTLGRLVWENSFETSNMLENTLATRLNVLPYAGELVMVYAHEGRIWYRIITENEVVVDKESYPVELPSAMEKVREHFTMNMTRWYDQYFLVYGRQSIRGADGKTRIVYYCTKLAFE